MFQTENMKPNWDLYITLINWCSIFAMVLFLVMPMFLAFLTLCIITRTLSTVSNLTWSWTSSAVWKATNYFTFRFGCLLDIRLVITNRVFHQRRVQPPMSHHSVPDLKKKCLNCWIHPHIARLLFMHLTNYFDNCVGLFYLKIIQKDWPHEKMMTAACHQCIPYRYTAAINELITQYTMRLYIS